MQRIKVWDLPVRLFHWAIVVLIFAAWLTQEFNRMDLHMWVGESILTLLLFRLERQAPGQPEPQVRLEW